MILTFGLTFCEKYSREDLNSGFQSTGVITGPDPRMCPSPCCGGWFIIIDSSTWEFDSLPSNSGIDLIKAAFPLKVRLDWQHATTGLCSENRIIIKRIAAVK